MNYLIKLILKLIIKDPNTKIDKRIKIGSIVRMGNKELVTVNLITKNKKTAFIEEDNYLWTSKKDIIEYCKEVPLMNLTFIDDFN